MNLQHLRRRLRNTWIVFKVRRKFRGTIALPEPVPVSIPTNRVVRTKCHPLAICAHTGILPEDVREYSVKFELEDGSTLDLHFGHEDFVGFSLLLCGWMPYLQRRQVYRATPARVQ